jgi:hypothetical protein
VTVELEIARSFAEFEALDMPYTIQVRGVSLWRLLRVAVGQAMQELPVSLTSLTRPQLIIATARSIGEIVWRPSPNADYMVKSYASSLRIEGAHGYEDIYFEALLKAQPRGVRWHSLNAPDYANRKHGLRSDSLDCTAIHTLGAALARVFPVREGVDAYAKLSTLVSQRLGVTGFTPRHIARVFSSFWWQARIFKQLIASSQVKTVIAADSEELALTFACRNLGVRFVELQHGVLNPDDPLCLPRAALDQATEQALLLPDARALYGEYWSASHTLTAMGELNRDFAVGSSTIDQYRAQRKTHFRPDAQCPRLVVTTQGLDRAALIGFIASFLSQYAGPCLITIKLHPAYDRSVEPYAQKLADDPRVEIVMGSALPNTYELIAQADLHISIASACHFDALGMGTPTVVLDLEGGDVVMDLVRSGDAQFARTPTDLSNIVTQQSWGKVSTSVSNKYFKPEYLSNILQLVR